MTERVVVGGSEDPRAVVGAVPAESGSVAAGAAPGEMPGMSDVAAAVAPPHGPECACTRCTGFQPGHSLSTTHGAYAVLSLGDRARVIAGGLQSQVGASKTVDTAAVELVATTLARVERATAALDGAPVGEMRELDKDLRAWIRLASAQLEGLGLSPAGRARIIRDGGTGVGMAGMGVGAMVGAQLDVSGAAETLRAELAAVVDRGEAERLSVAHLAKVFPPRPDDIDVPGQEVWTDAG